MGELVSIRSRNTFVNAERAIAELSGEVHAARSPAASAITIAFDLPCDACGYNLRTLASTAVCPECGKDVGESRRKYEAKRDELAHLRSCDATWLRAMHRGVALSFNLWLWSASISLLVAFVRLDALRWGNLFTQFVWMLAFVPIYVLGHFAAWQLLTNDRRWVSALLRVVLCLSLAALGAIFVNDMWDKFYRRTFGTLPPNWLLDDVQTFGTWAAFAWPVAIGATFFRLAQLAALSRLRWRAMFIAVYGVLSLSLSMLIAMSVRGRGAWNPLDVEVIQSLPGPTGTLPSLWIYSPAIGYEFIRMFTRPRWTSRWVLPALMLCGLALSLAVGIALRQVRSRIARTLRENLPASTSSIRAK